MTTANLSDYWGCCWWKVLSKNFWWPGFRHKVVAGCKFLKMLEVLKTCVKHFCSRLQIFTKSFLQILFCLKV